MWGFFCNKKAIFSTLAKSLMLMFSAWNTSSFSEEFWVEISRNVSLDVRVELKLPKVSFPPSVDVKRILEPPNMFG